MYKIAAQRERYKNIAAEARGELTRRGVTPKQTPPHIKAMAKMGIERIRANAASCFS